MCIMIDQQFEYATRMTKEEFNFALERARLLQKPEFQPLGLALSWELNELLGQINAYEDFHNPELLARAEKEGEWHAFWNAAPMGLQD